jgi:hypothetical protein
VKHAGLKEVDGPMEGVVLCLASRSGHPLNILVKDDAKNRFDPAYS